MAPVPLGTSQFSIRGHYVPDAQLAIVVVIFPPDQTGIASRSVRLYWQLAAFALGNAFAGTNALGCSQPAQLPEEPPAPVVVEDATPPVEPVVDVAADVDPAPPIEVPDPEPVIPAEPYEVLLLGDSLAATGFGVILSKKLDAHPHVTSYRKAKSASGLARPDFFDWMVEGKREVELRNPDLVIVIIGGNDGQDLVNGRGGGKRVRWDTEGWSEAYRLRVAAFLSEISNEGERRVMWLGLPKMGQRGLERKLELIRDVQRQAVAMLEDKGTYLETTPLLTDESGELLREVKVDGRTRRLREDDGVHFTMSGSQYFADHVYPEVLNVLGLEPVDK